MSFMLTTMTDSRNAAEQMSDNICGVAKWHKQHLFWAKVNGASCTCKTKLHAKEEGRNKAAECDGVIQYAFSVCWGSEHAAWLTSVRRRMSCNSPGGPIPTRGNTAQDAEILPQRPTTQDAASSSENERQKNVESFSLRVNYVTGLNRLNSQKRWNRQRVSPGPAWTLPERRGRLWISRHG